MNNKCEWCGKTKKPADFMLSTSPFWRKGHIHICFDCIEQNVDVENFNEVDRLLQLANIAFMPQEWRKISKREGSKAFRKYSQTYHEFNYYKYDWGEQNERLMDLARNGVVEAELDELKPGYFAKLRKTWGSLPDDELMWLEAYYNKTLSDYNVDSETQRDQFRKICLMSLAIDKKLKEGIVDKDLMTQYNNFMTTTLKNVEKAQSQAITSVGQIVEFIERNGYQASYYDGTPRDEIDMIINNMKEYTADLVRGETNLTELVSHVKDKYIRQEQTVDLTKLESGDEPEEESSDVDFELGGF